VKISISKYMTRRFAGDPQLDNLLKMTNELMIKLKKSV